MKKKPQNSWCKQELELLRQYYPVGGSPLVREKMRLHGYEERSKSSVTGRAWQLGLKSPLLHQPNRGCFQKGLPAHNRGAGMSEETREKVKHTWFKKGDVNWKTLEYDFAISYRKFRRQNEAYWCIRIAVAKWECLHVWLYCQLNDDPPTGHIVRIRDKDEFDSIVREAGFQEKPPKQEPEGHWQNVMKLVDATKHLLFCIPKAENMRRNSASLNMSDGWVVQAMTRKTPEIKELLLSAPEIIDLKRQVYQHKRQIKSLEENGNA